MLDWIWMSLLFSSVPFSPLQRSVKHAAVKPIQLQPILHSASEEVVLLRPGLCKRRRWGDPHYEVYRTSQGFCSMVRVNMREYQTDTAYESDELARENAAMRAYLICRNFSMTDGMYPGGHLNGVVQGMPVAASLSGRQSMLIGGYSSPSSLSYGSDKSVSPSSDEERIRYSGRRNQYR